MISSYFAVAAGGALGACARFGLSQWIKSPMATLMANGLGCLLMGILAGWLMTRMDATDPLRAFLLTGFLGALTTYSTFSFEALSMLNKGETTQAVGYIVATLLISLSACALGLSLARSI